MRHLALGSHLGFFSSKSKNPPANFGRAIEVRLEYVFNHWLDQPAGGVGRTCLIPSIRQCLIFRRLPICVCLSMTIPPPQDVQATHRRFDPISPPFPPPALKCPTSTNWNESSLAILPGVCEMTQTNKCFYSIPPSGIASVPGSQTTLTSLVSTTTDQSGLPRHGMLRREFSIAQALIIRGI